MKIFRRQEIEVNDVNKIGIGDQINILLSRFDKSNIFTATAYAHKDNGMLFMFDRCIAKKPMNINLTNKDGYQKSDLKEWIDTVLLNSFTKELKERIYDLAIPTYGMIFGHDEWYKELVISDNDEQIIPINNILKYDDCEWYWLQNSIDFKYSRTDFACYSSIGHPIRVCSSFHGGVRPIFWLK